MSSFCGGSSSVPSFTLSELNENFSRGIIQSVAPIPQAGTDGLVSEAWIQQTLDSLETSGVIPKPTEMRRVESTPFSGPETKDPLASYVSKDRAFQDKIKEEYCFYEGRYFSALNSFLDSISNSSLKGNPTDVNSKLTIVKDLNYKLIVLTQIVNGISKYRHTKNSQFQSEINSINSSLQQRSGRLQEQSDILKKETATADLHKRMVEYTLEKNNANQNLLTLFGVLNIIAIASIVYVSRS